MHSDKRMGGRVRDDGRGENRGEGGKEKERGGDGVGGEEEERKKWSCPPVWVRNTYNSGP